MWDLYDRHVFAIENHRLVGAVRCDSPNCGDRPAGSVIDLLVLHNISLPPGEFGGGWIEALFQNRLPEASHPYFATIAQLQVSAHLLIDRAGRVTQFVPFDKRAWHAGQSCWQGRGNCNDYSIGIELEGTDEQPYTEQQYRALVAIANTLMQHYPAITQERIIGHADIAPERKTDPGPAFDWDYFHQCLGR